MYWIIQDNIFNELFFDSLISNLKKFEIDYELVKVAPFSGEIISEPTPTSDKIVVIGSYSLTQEAIRRGWTPGAWTNENYDYRVWSYEWHGHCLNAPAKLYMFGNIPEREVPFFIRPCGDGKQFTGHVIEDWDKFKDWQNRVINLGETYTELDENTMCVIGDAYKIREEYRFVIVDGKVITGSEYTAGMYRECNPGQDQEVIDFAQNMCDIWVPSRAFALDIARSSGNLYVLEMGNVNAAGLYACDIQKIIIAFEEMKY